MSETLPRVVIIGGGFGGLRTAQHLKNIPAAVTLIDRSNHHLFQPLLYQVATAALSPADIAAPIRGVLRKLPNCEILLAEGTGVDTVKQEVYFENRALAYDYLVLATGARHSYFGKDDWEKFAPGLKTIQDATAIRQNILIAFEKAEMEPDSEIRKHYLNFVIVGGGPTGVEMAGSIAELASVALAADFKHIDPTAAQITLIEAGPRILAGFPEVLSENAKRSLERLGVNVITGARVGHIDENGVMIGEKRIFAKTIIWAAGVVASPAGRWLHTDTDRVGRVIVEPNLSLPGHANVFVIGDTALVKDEEGKPLPGVAPVAMQEGVYVANLISNRIKAAQQKKTPPVENPFRYRNKGNLATIGRSSAIADIGKFKLSGFIAWFTWLFVHIFYLIGFRNRLVVIIQWAWSYFTFQRGARLITMDENAKARTNRPQPSEIDNRPRSAARSI